MNKIISLKKTSNIIRKSIIETIYNAGGGHLGGSLSAVDILASLYFDIMNINPQKPNDPNRDRFILSKGHASVALYSTLALKGYFDKKELNTFGKIDSRLQTHPDMALLSGIDFSTGSLGQGISGAVGMALSGKLKGGNFKVYCMIGDGESQEGQVWEAAILASKYNLNNLTVIIDYNRLQQYGWNHLGYYTAMDNLHEKWKSFGWDVLDIIGHNFGDILCSLNKKKYKPTIIIANTIKGKGISFMEDNYLYHSKSLTDAEYVKAMEELNNA